MDDEKQQKPEQKNKQPQQTPQKKSEESTIPPQITKDIDEIMRRLRLIEDRYYGLRKKTQLTEQNMLKDAKELSSEIGVLNISISQLKGEFSEINEKLLKLSEEVNESVDKSEFHVIAKYLEFWQPLDFLSRAQAQRLIDEAKKQQN